MKVFSIIIHNFNLVSSKFAFHLRPQFLVHMYTFPFFVFIQQKNPMGRRSSHPSSPTNRQIGRGKVQGTWSQHQQQQVQDLSKAISDHTKYRTEELTPFAPRRRVFFEKFWWCSTGWVTDGLRLSFGRMFLCGCWCWVVWVLCFGFGKGWSTIGCEFDVPKKGVFLQKKTEEGTESSQIFHLKKDE